MERDNLHYDAEDGENHTLPGQHLPGGFSPWMRQTQGHPVGSGHVSGGGLLWNLGGRARDADKHPTASPRRQRCQGCVCRFGDRDCDSPQAGFNDLNLSLFIKI